jgi:tetratricopeptide (TPR) repeat protein
MKVIVYTICKNEAKFIKRWYDSMQEADEIYVLDTGSTDNSVEFLKQYGVHVKSAIIKPWRFDVARNESLKMVPNDADICVCTDLDEVFNQGWRQELEQIWTNNTTRCHYIYNWRLDTDNKPLVTFYYEKIHSRKHFKWVNPVHEVLNYDGIENQVTTDKIVLNHYPDATKSRSSYLSLLELAIKEDPLNDRNWHYLGREYMFHQKWNKAIDTLEHHINMKEATWLDEKSASMRFIARCYTHLYRYEEAKMWYDKAINLTPYLRDPLIEKAILMYTLKDYNQVLKLVRKALKIPINNRSYINEIFTFDHTAYDLLSLVYDTKKQYHKALYYVKQAIKISPQDERLQKNYDIIKQEVKYYENTSRSKC